MSVEFFSESLGGKYSLPFIQTLKAKSFIYLLSKKKRKKKKNVPAINSNMKSKFFGGNT
jgi:hypothetical protein